MNETYDTAVHQQQATHGIVTNKLSADAPYRWLRQGWQDLRATPKPSLFLGSLFVLAGYAIIFASWKSPVLTITYVTGFLLVAPAFALGFYELSKRRAEGKKLGFNALAYSWKQHGWSVLLFGLLLGVLMVAWGRLTGLIVAVALPTFGPYSDLLSWQVMTSPAFIALYFAGGFLLAAIAFGISVVSIPMLIDRQIDVLTAAVTSLRAVRQNFGVMAIWAFIIALITTAAMLFGLLGLIISMPLLGHASWHAYKETIPS